MLIDVLTLFPEMFPGVLGASMLGRAAENGLLSICVHDIRDYTDNKHRKADDYPFGGGAGLVMMAQPVFDCVQAVLAGEPARRILLSPAGKAAYVGLCARTGGGTPSAAALRPLRGRG